MNVLIVFLGAGLGGALRYAAGLAAVRMDVGSAGATLFVNVVGCLLMGALAAFLVRGGVGPGWQLFVATGLLGGFTTFSAFSLDLIQMVERGSYLGAGLYIAASIILSLAAAASAYTIVKDLISP